jgi:hypothetical protein
MPILFISPQRKIALTYLILTIILLIIVLLNLYSLSVKASILISVKPHILELNFNETFNAKIFEEILNEKGTYSPKALVTMEDYAQGEVIIVNNSNQNQILVKNTRLLSPENLLFRLTERIVIPANQKKKALVRADKPGPTYEIGPTKFIFPGLSPLLREKIYAESREPMTGGLKKAGIVTQEDINNAVTELKNKLQKQALENLEKKFNNKNIKIAFHSEILDQNINAKPNEERDNFTVELTLKTVAAAIPEIEFLQKINEKIKNQIPSDQKLVSIDQSSFAYRLKSYDLENQKVNLEIYLKVKTILSEKSDLLAKNFFTNKTREEIKTYLKNIEDIKEVKIIFSPFFLKKSPSNEKKIILKTYE